MNKEFYNTKPYITLTNDSTYVLRDLHHELKAEVINDSYGFMYHENFGWFDDFTTSGCQYQRMGCVINDGDIVVDIGANIGAFTNRALADGASKVFAFEPNNLTYACLVQNTSNDVVSPFNIAIGASPDYAMLETHTVINDLGGSSFSLYNKENLNIVNTQPSIIMPLDMFYKMKLITKIDFLKVDCEGYEYEVLRGISDENLETIDRIAFEMHSNVIGEEKIQEMYIRLTNAGFKSFRLYLGDSALSIFNFWR